MGLNVESPVCINSSFSNPDQLKDLLNSLIKRARILNLNEVTCFCISAFQTWFYCPLAAALIQKDATL